ncbi:MAG: glycerophosphodiester phosphodiesterase family protein [Gemmatimonadaceae bacterium]
MNILTDRSSRPVIGHRGNRAYAPENTIESFAQAVAAGADAIELDVHLSADGVAVVCHDPHVRRTTDGTGDIARMTFDELRKLDAGARFTPDAGKTYPYRGLGHRIPSLDEVLEAFPATPILIEIKTASAAHATRKVIEGSRGEQRVLVDAMDPAALRPFADSAIAIGASRADVTRAMIEILLHRPMTPFAFKALCIPLHYNGIPIPVLRLARLAPEQNCVVHVWTVNDTRVASDLWLAGVAGIISDDPAAMLRARAFLPR